ncbi:MAG: hypothetical protein KC635_14215, partial [Myxococcales bacterium]|nr:hypothetical protein [Myxococcales bacterium]
LARLAAATVLALAACGDDGAATPSDTLVADTVVTDTADATAPDDTVADTESDTASPPDAADDTSPDAADTSAPAELDGFDRAAASVRVAARHWPDNPAQTVVVGTLWAADPPQGFALDATDGACRLSFGVNPFCSTPCEDGLCTAPDVCTPWPLNASAGDLRVAGGAADWSYRHAVSGYGAAYDETPFAGDDVITVSAPGGADFPAFSGAVAFPPPIEADVSGLDLDGDGPLVITWTPPPAGTEGTRVLVRLMADRGQHGRFPASMVECDVPDTGSVTIPEALRDAYSAPELFTCGKCPASAIIRYRRTRVRAGEHDVDLWAESELTFLLTPWTP